jgi:hypothetical protein
MLLSALERAQASPEETLMIGLEESPTVEAATRLDIACIELSPCARPGSACLTMLTSYPCRLRMPVPAAAPLNAQGPVGIFLQTPDAEVIGR